MNDPETFASPPAMGPTDYEVWRGFRDNRLRASRSSGALHLDQVPRYVEDVRGRLIRNVHDAREWGVAYTVMNSGNILVLWPDAHSQTKNDIGLAKFKTVGGKPLGLGSLLSPSDQEDYLVESGPRPILDAISTKPRKATQPALL